MNPLLTIINDGDKECHELAAINYNLYFAGTCRRADTGEDWTNEQAENEIKDFIHSRELALVEGLKARYEVMKKEHCGQKDCMQGQCMKRMIKREALSLAIADLDEAITHLKK